MTSLLLSILRKFDYFGVQFNFLYNTNNKFTSATGGFIFILFLLLAIIFILINAWNFIFRKTYSVIYYDLQLSEPDIINIHNFSSALAFGVDCNMNDIPIYDLFSIQYNHVSMIKNQGVISKIKTNIQIHPCTESDFYNEFDEEFTQIGMNKYFCVTNTINNNTGDNFTTQGIYSAETFTYFEILVSAKEQNANTYENIKYFLSNGECHITYYFIDVAIHLENFKHPVKRFINKNFMSIKPDEYSKMNLYFHIKEFSSFENIIFDSHVPNYYIGYSSQEVYAIYKGEERFVNKYIDYEKYAKIYIRSALSRNIIQRKYLKLTEFAADMACILNQVLLLLFTIMTPINRFYGNNIIMSKLFTFKECSKGRENMFRREYNKIFREINLKQDYASSDVVDCFMINHNNQNIIVDCETGLTHKKRSSLNNTILKSNKMLNNSNNNIITSNHNILLNNSINNTNNKSSLLAMKTPSVGFHSKNGINVSNNRQTEYELRNMNNSNNQSNSLGNLERGRSGTITRYINNKKIKNIKLTYSCHEYLISFFCPTYGSNDLQTKNKLFIKAKKKFTYELDVFTYLKNTQILEIVNYLLLEHHENIILQFLSKPVISLADRIDIHDQLQLKYNYESHYEKEAVDVCKVLKMIYDKKEKTNEDKKLLNLVSIELCNLLEEK